MKRIRVLIVEDSPVVAEHLRRIVAADGRFEVVGVVGSGEEAVDVVEPLAPDVITMDIHLPGMDGLSVVRQMKQNDNTRAIPVLALTAHAMRGDRDRFLEAGCDGYISKPIDVKTFIPSLQRYLGFDAQQ